MNGSVSRISVAMVDDDPAVRERVGKAFEADAGIELRGAFADAHSSMEWLSQHAVDVLLVDLGLPDLPGLAVITYCAQRHPGTDIMVLTVFDDAEKVLQSVRAGASGYLLKDSLNDEIVTLVRQLRAGGAPMSPSIARLVLRQARPSLPSPAALEPLSGVRLTPAEDNVLNHVARGFKTAEIARLNGVTIHTVHTHIKNIYAKLSVSSRSEAVFEASRLGLLERVFPADGRR